MLVLRNENDRGGPGRRIRQPPLHLKAVGQGLEALTESSIVQGEIRQVPFDAHEEEAEIVVLVLIGVENIGSPIVQKTGDRGDNSFAVGAMDQENGGVRHLYFLHTAVRNRASGLRYSFRISRPPCSCSNQRKACGV